MVVEELLKLRVILQKLLPLLGGHGLQLFQYFLEVMAKALAKFRMIFQELRALLRGHLLELLLQTGTATCGRGRRLSKAGK